MGGILYQQWLSGLSYPSVEPFTYLHLPHSSGKFSRHPAMNFKLKLLPLLIYEEYQGSVCIHYFYNLISSRFQDVLQIQGLADNNGNGI